MIAHANVGEKSGKDEELKRKGFWRLEGFVFIVLLLVVVVVVSASALGLLLIFFFFFQ